MTAVVSTFQKSSADVPALNSAIVQTSLAARIGTIALKGFLAAAGLFVGSVFGFLIALFSGLVDFTC